MGHREGSRKYQSANISAVFLIGEKLKSCAYYLDYLVYQWPYSAPHHDCWHEIFISSTQSFIGPFNSGAVLSTGFNWIARLYVVLFFLVVSSPRSKRTWLNGIKSEYICLALFNPLRQRDIKYTFIISLSGLCWGPDPVREGVRERVREMKRRQHC